LRFFGRVFYFVYDKRPSDGFNSDLRLSGQRCPKLGVGGSEGRYILRKNREGLREKNDVMFFSQPWFGSSEFSQLCSRHVIRAQHFSRVVSENYCVIGQFEVGVVNALSAGAECLA